jgi:uncharacterized membrane protein YbhN (UPF0104 family)
VLQFVEPSPELKDDPCAELRRRGLDCTEEVEEARKKAPESRTIFINGLLAAGLAVLAAAAVIWVPFLQPIRDRFADTEPGWVVASFVLQLLSVLSFVVALRGAFERRLGWREAFDVGVVEESANVFLPSGGSGGLALGAVILIRSGIPTAFAASRSAVLFLVTSAVSGFALIVFGLGEAIGIFPGDADLTATLIPGLAGAFIIVAIIFLPRAIPQLDADKGGKIRRAVALAQAWLVGAVDTSMEMVLGRREILLIAGSIGYYAFDVASMGAAFAALGGGAPALGLFVLAYTIGHAGAIVPLPGSAEGGLVGAFTLYGSPLSLAVGGILLYRVFHAGVPFLLGALGLADMSRQRRRAGSIVPTAEVSPAPAAAQSLPVTKSSPRQNSNSTSEPQDPSYVDDEVSSVSSNN